MIIFFTRRFLEFDATTRKTEELDHYHQKLCLIWPENVKFQRKIVGRLEHQFHRRFFSVLGVDAFNSKIFFKK